jgi:2-methylfumaryl-CoA hydratase
MVRTLRYGRNLEDFQVGATYAHPWEVTIDSGMMALFAASFQDATPAYASRDAARELGFIDRPVHPILLLNLALSFSVHDVSEQAIAHLAYLDVRFPEASHAGDTVRAASRVLGVTPSTRGDRGVVHVQTTLFSDGDRVVCSFERKALVRGGRVVGRPIDAPHERLPSSGDLARTPPALGFVSGSNRPSSFPTYFEDVTVGDIFLHDVGRTVSEAEHMQLATLFRNSHPLHVDERYAAKESFTKTRAVYGGLVLAWTLSLASRDTAGNALWDAGLDEGAHPNGVVAGDTIYAASKVLAKEDSGPNAGLLKLRVVGMKNITAHELFAREGDMFAPELGKSTQKLPEKVVEITRTLLVRKRQA